jgi:hypothetical protein
MRVHINGDTQEVLTNKKSSTSPHMIQGNLNRHSLISDPKPVTRITTLHCTIKPPTYGAAAPTIVLIMHHLQESSWMC